MPQDPAGHALGRYGGVVPGNVATPPAPPAPNDGKPVITWPGFQMRTDGTSRVFIQSTVALSPQPSAAPGRFSVILPGAKVAAGTNRLPLETRFFNTPVTRVNIAVQREAVTVTLDLRAEVAPVISSERGPNGFYFVYIDLPKGQYTKTQPTAIDAPPAPPPTPRARTTSGQALGPSSLSTSASGKAEAESSTEKASAKISGKAGIKLGP